MYKTILVALLLSLFLCSDDSDDKKKETTEEKLAKKMEPVYELLAMAVKKGAYEVVVNQEAMKGNGSLYRPTACPAVVVKIDEGKIGIEYDDGCEPIQGNLYMSLDFQDLLTKFELTFEIEFDSIRMDETALVGEGEMTLKGNKVTFKLEDCKAYLADGKYELDSELELEIDLRDITSFDDDVIWVDGGGELETPDGQEYVMEIRERLKFSSDCVYIRQGVLRLSWNSVYGEFDFYPENGECDSKYDLDIGFN